MSSRMDRYYKKELVEPNRSNKNRSLYTEIEDLDSYSSIEGVASIEKTNEIDISKVQEMIKNRENYKKQKKYRDVLMEEKEKLDEEIEEVEEERNYDIKDILSKIDSESKNDPARSLDKEQLRELKSMNKVPKKYDIEKEEQELKELIDTISSKKFLEDVKNSDDVGLFDDLKSDTMVGTASSIKKIIDDEKEKEDMTDTMEIDKSFYTSSLGFTQRDFDEIRDMNKKIKKSNKFIIVLLVLVIIALIVFFILK